jgi:integrase
MNSNDEKTSVWETVGPNLLKNQTSGKYYGRFKIPGKNKAGTQKWVSLKTTKRAVADVRLAEERKRVSFMRQAHGHVGEGIGTMGELAKIYTAQLEGNPSIGPKTRTRYKQHLAAVLKTWPEFASMKPDRLTKDDVMAWRNRIAKDGTGWIAPGAKGRSTANDGSSAGGINKSLDAIRRLMEIAVEKGQLAKNPLQGRDLKLSVKPKKPHLPEARTIEAIFANMESRGAGRPQHCAELARFLAYTGLRLAEAVGDPTTGAAGVTWADVDFTGGLIRVHGTKTEAAARTVPMIPAARALLETIQERRLEGLREIYGPDAKIPPADRVLFVREAQKALTRACAEVGAPRLTHHDLRDVFATSCIEAGVDIPTVAAWLGHADGGALLMRTYSHLRQKHSLAQAAKVKIGGAA